MEAAVGGLKPEEVRLRKKELYFYRPYNVPYHIDKHMNFSDKTEEE